MHISCTDISNSMSAAIYMLLYYNIDNSWTSYCQLHWMWCVNCLPTTYHNSYYCFEVSYVYIIMYDT